MCICASKKAIPSVSRSSEARSSAAGGMGMMPAFTVRRIASNGIGVERTFLTRSPRLEKVIIQRHSQVRRAKLYHLRERTGKNARLKQKFTA